MAVVWTEGWDAYNGFGANTGAGSRWITLSGGDAAAALITGRFGGQGGRFCNLGGSNTVVRAPLPTTYTTVTLAFAFRFPILGQAVDFVFLALDDTPQVGLRLTTTGAIDVYRSSGYAGSVRLGGTAAGVVFQNTWHFAEFSTTIDNSAGTVALKIDGATVLSTVSSLDTQAGASAGVNMVVIRGGLSASNYCDIDDMYVLNSLTSKGELRIETIRPNADTATKDWIPNSGSTNSTQVDETTANGDTDYVQSTNVGDHDLYDLTDLSTTPTAIHAVRPVICARKTDSATRQLNVTIQSGGTDADSTAVNLAANYNFYGPTIYETDPHDSAVWTKAKVDALKLGPKVAS